jgi:diphthine methyl ester acylhydrolase
MLPLTSSLEYRERIASVPIQAAILDIQWTPHVSELGLLLAAATSTGQLVFYRLVPEQDDEPGQLVLYSEKAVADPAILVLSLAWHPNDPHTIGLTLSNGTVSLCRCSGALPWNETCTVTLTEIQHHSLEAWTMAFSDDHVLSGGDDIVLQCSRTLEDGSRTVLWQDRKLHEAGVTAILPIAPDLIVTGSYDDRIRLISFSPGSRRQTLAEENLGGGVWRLKLLTTSSMSNREGSSARKEVTRYVFTFPSRSSYSGEYCFQNLGRIRHESFGPQWMQGRG